jgi:hypothetical protein
LLDAPKGDIRKIRTKGNFGGIIKMGDFLLAGTLIGLLFSLFHAAYMSRLVLSGANSTTPGSPLSALNFAVWTCGLWILMGSYLLGFWLIAVVLYIVFKAFR